MQFRRQRNANYRLGYYTIAPPDLPAFDFEEQIPLSPRSRNFAHASTLNLITNCNYPGESLNQNIFTRFEYVVPMGLRSTKRYGTTNIVSLRDNTANSENKVAAYAKLRDYRNDMIMFYKWKIPESVMKQTSVISHKLSKTR